MIIAFAIISLIIISGLSIGIYAIFIPFMQNISDIQAYNTAYYGAIAATERALLVTKQQQFGFNGSGGRRGISQRGPISDYKDPDMGVLSQENNGIQREIKGKTKRIPQEGKGNIPQIFSANDSSNFNSFSSQDTILVATQINANNDPQLFYTSINNSEQPARSFIKTQRRIPPYIQEQQDESTALLCDTYNLTCNTDSEIDDDVIVLRQRRGILAGSEFSIIPTTQIFKTPTLTDVNSDMHIRESVINTKGESTIDFSNNYNPITGKPIGIEHTTLGPGGDDIKNIVFADIFNTPNIEELYLQYTMLQTPISKAGFVYPFLEYAIVSDAEMSDTHRHIESKSIVGNYQVRIQIDKPQNENIKGSNFTIIF